MKFRKLLVIVNRPDGILEKDGDVVVQAGVIWNILNDTLKEKGKSPSEPPCSEKETC